jgi:hypothetical protein
VKGGGGGGGSGGSGGGWGREEQKFFPIITRQNKFDELLDVCPTCFVLYPLILRLKKIFPKPLDILRKTRYIIKSEEKHAPIV